MNRGPHLRRQALQRPSPFSPCPAPHSQTVLFSLSCAQLIPVTLLFATLTHFQKQERAATFLKSIQYTLFAKTPGVGVGAQAGILNHYLIFVPVRTLRASPLSPRPSILSKFEPHHPRITNHESPPTSHQSRITSRYPGLALTLPGPADKLVLLQRLAVVQRAVPRRT